MHRRDHRLTLRLLGLATAVCLLGGLGALVIPATAATAPNDPLYPYQYGPPQIRAEGAWDRSTGAGVVVSVIDTGIDLDHPDLMDHTLPGRAFLDCGDAGCGNGDWQSPPNQSRGHPHGTHVAGTVAAVTNNGIGVAGVAPDAEVMAVRVLNDVGFGTSRDVGRGIRWSADNGADVINMSLGDEPGTQINVLTQEEEQYLRDSVTYATSKGVVVVAAAGNDFASICGTPSFYAGALCVSATKKDETPSEFSNFATKPDLLGIAAPGGTILPLECGDMIVSTVPPGSADPTVAEDCAYPADLAYDEYSGTSMATPHAAGVAALLVGMGCTRDQTVSLMTTTARRPGTDVRGGWDPRYGYGIVDAGEATARAAGACTTGTGENRQPVAGDDSLVAAFGRATEVDVLANDTDPEGQPLTLVSAGGASGGTVDIHHGTVHYTPSPDAGPTDAFRYSVADAAGAITAATVRVAVGGQVTMVDAPEPAVLHLQGNRDENCTGDGRLDVLGSLAECEGPALSPSPVLDAGAAARWVPATQSDGTNYENIYDPHWTWDAPAPATLRDAVSVEWWASCTTCAAATPATWNIRVFADGQPVAEAPVQVRHTASPELLRASVSLAGDVTVRRQLTVQVDPARPVTVPPPATNQADAFVIWYDSQQPCPGAAAGPCDSLVRLTVVGKNAVPIAGDDSIAVGRNKSGVVDVTANDVDPDLEPLEVVDFTEPARGGTVTRTGGVFTYTPRTGFSGTDTFTYTVSDPRGATDTATVTVTVTRR